MNQPAVPRFVDAGGHPLRLWQAGSGPQVVVLPGLVRAARDVAGSLAARAGELSFCVLELPGTGGSADLPFRTLDDVATAVAQAIDAAGLRASPLLALDLAAPIARRLEARCTYAGLARAGGWAARFREAPDFSPRADGTHLNALFAHLRNAHLLDPRTGRRAAGDGEALPTADELDAVLLAAGMRPEAYSRLWTLCCQAMHEEQSAEDLDLEMALAAVGKLGRQPAAQRPPPATAAPTRPGRSYAQIPRGRVHLRTAGPQRSPLIALHSAPGSAAPLFPLLDTLAKTRRVIAPDYIGNGDSDKVDAPVDIATLGRDVLDLADALQLERFDLWGTHTGALIALEAAIAAPQRIGRVILEAPPLLDPRFSAQLLANYFPELRPDAWGLYLQKAWNMRRDMFLFWPWYRDERAAARPIDLPDPAFLHDWTLGLLSSGTTYHRSYRAAFEYDTASRLPLLQTPALVCAGPADMLADGLQAARALLPAGSVVMPTPATVWYPNQDPRGIDATLALYQRFLDSGAAAAA